VILGFPRSGGLLQGGHLALSGHGQLAQTISSFTASHFIVRPWR
jgi:hypothetical protein